ncbi:hypothetical protein D3C84_867590 [compost metagenome]
MHIELAQLRQARRAAGRQSPARGLNLTRFLCQLLSHQRPIPATIPHFRQCATRRGFAVLAQAGIDDQRRCIQPGGARRHIVCVSNLQREMPPRLQRECRMREAVSIVVAIAGGEPLCQHSEIGRAVAAPAASLIDCRDGT